MSIPKTDDEWRAYWRKKEERETADAVHNGGQGDGDWFGEPRCPWCGAGDHDWWDHDGFRSDGDTIEMTCHVCDRKYAATMCVESSFRSHRVQPQSQNKKEP